MAWGMPIRDSRKEHRIRHRHCLSELVSSGLTLPVWVVAAAKASLHALLGQPFANQVSVSLPDRTNPVLVPVISAARLDGGDQALAISRCDPGPRPGPHP
jgi:cobalt-precorrin-5B (C1)-methyltransferase